MGGDDTELVGLGTLELREPLRDIEVDDNEVP